MSNFSDKFFRFNREMPEQGGIPAYTSLCAVAWDSIERVYTEDDGELRLVLKSMTDGYRNNEVYEGRKLVMRSTKTPMNVQIAVTNKDDIERFFNYLPQIAIAPYEGMLNGVPVDANNGTMLTNHVD